MKGLLIKDFKSMKYTLKGNLLFICIFLVIGIFSNNPVFITTFMTILGLNHTISTMSYDESYGWNQYALTMPIKRKDLVISKYLFSYLILFSSLILTTIFLIIASFFNTKMILGEFLSVILASFVVVGYMISTMIALIIKKGVEKSRSLFFLVIFIPGLLITGLIFISKSTNIFQLTEELFLKLLIVSPLILLLYTFITMKIAINTLEKKDL